MSRMPRHRVGNTGIHGRRLHTAHDLGLGVHEGAIPVEDNKVELPVHAGMEISGWARNFSSTRSSYDRQRGLDTHFTATQRVPEFKARGM